MLYTSHGTTFYRPISGQCSDCARLLSGNVVGGEASGEPHEYLLLKSHLDNDTSTYQCLLCDTTLTCDRSAVEAHWTSIFDTEGTPTP